MSHHRNKIVRRWLYFRIRDKRKNHLYSYVIGVFITFFIYWLFAWIISKDRAEAGTFGDQFGGLNAIISGLAFVGLFISLQLQRKELRLQREDLRLQRGEMRMARQEAEHQTEQFIAQVKLGRNSNFANEFFQRLSLLKSIEKDLVYNNKNGAEATVLLASDIYHIIQNLQSNNLAKASSLLSKNQHNIFISIDKFKVWGNSFLLLINDIYSQQASYAILEARKAANKNLARKLIKEAVAAIRHYQTILINSSIWGEQFLLLLLYNTIDEGQNSALTKLEKIDLFANGNITKKAKQKDFQLLFRLIFELDENSNLNEQLSTIYHKYQNYINTHQTM